MWEIQGVFPAGLHDKYSDGASHRGVRQALHQGMIPCHPTAPTPDDLPRSVQMAHVSWMMSDMKKVVNKIHHLFESMAVRSDYHSSGK
jgi:hypothetical protein